MEVHTYTEGASCLLFGLRPDIAPNPVQNEYQLNVHDLLVAYLQADQLNVLAVYELLTTYSAEIQTWVKIALAFEIRMRIAISLATKLSGMETTTQPARIMARYAVTACTFICMSIAIESPFLNPSASRELATRLSNPQKHEIRPH